MKFVPFIEQGNLLHDYSAILSELKEHPGEWGLAFETQASRNTVAAWVSRVNAGKAKWCGDSVQAKRRKTDTGYEVWLKYVK